MPESTLLQSDLNELNRIANIMLPVLWTEMPPVISDDLTENQKNAIFLVIDRIFGDNIGQLWTETDYVF